MSEVAIEEAVPILAERLVGESSKNQVEGVPRAPTETELRFFSFVLGHACDGPIDPTIEEGRIGLSRWKVTGDTGLFLPVKRVAFEARINDLDARPGRLEWQPEISVKLISRDVGFVGYHDLTTGVFFDSGKKYNGPFSRLVGHHSRDFVPTKEVDDFIEKFTQFEDQGEISLSQTF